MTSIQNLHRKLKFEPSFQQDFWSIELTEVHFRPLENKAPQFGRGLY